MNSTVTDIPSTEPEVESETISAANASTSTSSQPDTMGDTRPQEPEVSPALTEINYEIPFMLRNDWKLVGKPGDFLIRGPKDPKWKKFANSSQLVDPG